MTAARRTALLGAFVATLAVAAGITTVHRSSGDTAPPVPDLAVDDGALTDVATALSGQSRPVYPYSVIPGGAYTPEEFVAAADRDPVVSTAYSAVERSHLHAETVAAARLAYMSYRKDGRVYWTKHRISLRRGETILTDGAAQIRARCGNGISDEPMAPVAETDPDPLVFDAVAYRQPPAAMPGAAPAPLSGHKTGIDGGLAPAAAGFSGLGAAVPLAIAGMPSAPGGAADDLLPFPGMTGLTPPDGLAPPDGLPSSGHDGVSPPQPGLGSVPPPRSNGGLTPNAPPFNTGAFVPPDNPSGGVPTVTPPPDGPSDLPVDTPDDLTNPVVTPEPGTLILVGSGLAAGFLKRRKRK